MYQILVAVRAGKRPEPVDFAPMGILGKLTAPLVLGALLAAPAHAAGGLDPAFGNAGEVLLDYQSNDHVDALRVLDDGAILAVSLSFDETSNQGYFNLTRRLADGSPDPSFGDAGTVTAPLPSLPDPPLSVALQADGKVVVAGHASRRGVIVRLLTDGTPDDTFSDEGYALGDYGYNVYFVPAALDVQDDGKVVVVGKVGGPYDSTYQRFGVMRFNAAGEPDSPFGTVGPGRSYSETGYSPGEKAHAVAVQPDGKIVAAGEWYGQFAVARFNTNGTQDTTLGCDGFVSDAVSHSARIQKVAIAPNGAIVAAGTACDMFTNVCRAALVRYRRDGDRDTSFGGDGRVDLDELGAIDALAVQPDGAIVVTGHTYAEDGTPTGRLLRLAVDGTPDATFNADAFGASFLASVHADAAGGLLVAGWREGATPADFDGLIARVLRGTDGAAPTALPEPVCNPASDTPEDPAEPDAAAGDGGAPGPGLIAVLGLAALRRRLAR